MNIYLSHSGNYDYESELYIPLKGSKIAQNHKIFFPHDKENIDTNSKDLINHVDLVIAEVSYPSTVQGIELGRASSSNKPILCMYKVGSRVSNSLRFITKDMLAYENAADMLSKLESWLAVR